VKLHVKAMALAAGVMWGLALLLVGLANLVWEGYGVDFLKLAASIYPGYSGAASLWQVIVATLYGLVDGAIAGAVLAWLYNLCVPPAAAGH
jgi:hypothetical protein